MKSWNAGWENLDKDMAGLVALASRFILQENRDHVASIKERLPKLREIQANSMAIAGSGERDAVQKAQLCGYGHTIQRRHHKNAGGAERFRGWTLEDGWSGDTVDKPNVVYDPADQRGSQPSDWDNRCNCFEPQDVPSSAMKTASETNAIVTKLGESSREIGQVIKVITSIAQKTDLLALNATWKHPAPER
jgi:hypothetical protein